MAGIIVGSVGVTVYPSTERFWQEFKAKTKAGAEQAGEQLANDLSSRIAGRLARAVTQGLQSSAPGQQGRRAGVDYADAFTREVKTRIEAAVRSLGPRVRVDADTSPARAEMEALRRGIRETEAHLRIGRIDDAQAIAQINAIQARLEVLARTDPDVRVRVNAAAASAQLATLQAQTNTLGQSVANIGTQAQGSTSRLQRLLRVAALLAPALIPIGAVAVPAILALGAGAGVAGLAVYGLAKDVDALSSAAVKSELSTLTADLRELSGVAARGAAPALVDGMEQLRELLPGITDDVSLISAQVATVAGNTGVGFVRIFEAAAPVIDRMLNGLVRFSDGFATFGGSPEFQRFLEYAEAKIPEVKAFLVEFGTAIGHIVEAAAPWGSIVLGAFTAVSQAINAIPIPILTQLITTFELLLVLKMANALSAIGVSTTAMATAFAAARTAGAGMAASLGAAALASGPLLLALAAIAGAAYGITHMTVKIADSTEHFGELTAAIRADNLALGDNTKQALAATLQQDGLAKVAEKAGLSLQDVIGGITGTDGEFQTLGETLNTTGDLSLDLTNELRSLRTGFENDTAAAEALEKLLAGPVPSAFEKLGQKASYTTVTINGTTFAMKDQTSAADVLKNALDNLSGKKVDAAQAELAFQSSIFSVTAALRESSGAFDSNTAEGVANQQAILGLIEQANAHAQAVFEQTGSVDAATAALEADKQKLYETALAAGENTAAVQEMIDKYAAVPSDVTTTVIANTENARTNIDALYASIQNLPREVRIAAESTLGVPAADGAIYKGFANGGLTAASYAEGAHVAEIAQPTYRLWAEPETGGEAYIPMALSKRARSTAILNTVAERFGLALTSKIGAYSSGAVVGSSVPSAGGGRGPLIGSLAISEVSDANGTATALVRRLVMLDA